VTTDHLSPASFVLCYRLPSTVSIAEACCPHFFLQISFAGVLWSPFSSVLVLVWQCCRHFSLLLTYVKSSYNFIFLTDRARVPSQFFLLLPPPTKLRRHCDTPCLWVSMTVCVCLQDISKSYWRIWTKFCGVIGLRQRSNRLNFGTDLLPDLDAGWIFFHFFNMEIEIGRFKHY